VLEAADTSMQPGARGVLVLPIANPGFAEQFAEGYDVVFELEARIGPKREASNASRASWDFDRHGAARPIADDHFA
jgi:hypothetical protein